MAITDLTNTTWEVPSGWSASAGYGQFSINGRTIGGTDFTHFNIGYRFDTETYALTALANTIAILYNGAIISNFVSASQATLTFTITGGTDVTNPDLISWLEANGTLQGGSEPVTIKAGTYTWNETIPQSGWCSGTTVKSVMFNFKVGIGYNKYGFHYTNIDEETYTTSWTLSDTDWLVNRLMGYTFSSNYWSNGGVRTFTVETDQEVTGDDPQGFMDYLTANSDYGSQSEPEQTDTKPIYKRVNGAWVKLTAFERVNGEWVKISSAVETEEPEQPQEPEIVPYLTFSSASSFTIGVIDNKKYWDGTLEYSTDGSTWTTWAGTSAISSASDGTKHNLYLRGTGNTYITGSSGSSSKAKWVLTGSNISCSGNIENLLDYATVANGGHPTMATYCYSNMFRGCTSLTTAPELPATTLANYCYTHMFYGCTSLTTAPALPATTLATYCYRYMFYGCTSLVTAPELPATTLASNCYQYMFYGCTSLVTAPELPATTLASTCYQYMFYNTSLTTAPELPATTLAAHCYSNMFRGCTSLTTAPELPATTLADYCYNEMFYGCTSLTTAPELPATTLADYCYNGMFNSCTNLVTAPTLPATTLKANCYANMFYGCTSLVTAPILPATTLSDYCYYYMFYGCTSLTTAPELPATTLKANCYNGMFNSCTNLVTAPTLPATTLATYCYANMLRNCKSLTTLPVLSATTLASNCYYYMFGYCTQIKLSTTQTDDYQTAYRIPTSGTGTTATNALRDMFINTGGTFTGTPSINTTYYTSNTVV